ncbi:MAG: ABC transporter permease [Pseudomonadota bacterium]
MTHIKFAFLWTDILIYCLLLVVGLYVWRARSKAHLAAPWRKVARRPAAMASAVVLCAFLAMGLLDSVHFREALPNQKPGAATEYSLEVISALDRVLKPLRTQTEKTYSAPLAIQLYAMESMEQPDGRTLRGHPRLKHGGAHLGQHSEGRHSDVLWLVAQGTLIALLIWCVLLIGVGRRVTWRALLHGETELPWRTILFTLGGLLWLACVLWLLAPKYHVFGTDKVGQDVLYLSLKSIRTGLVIGTLTVLIMLPFALWLGVMAGYFKGWVDDVIQYVYSTLNAIPDVLLIAAAVLMMQVYMDINKDAFASLTERADFRLLFLCLILGITSWTSLCRLLRGETLKLTEVDYVQAAQAFGVSHWQIMARHILPNVMHIVLITVTLRFSSLVLAEAVLAYVGVGVDPTMHSWGNMINSARLELAREPIVWWPLAAAFVFMFALVLAANLFADAVRDAFDPRSE